MTHPDFRRKLEAVGFGIFIPVFFVSSGVNYDLDALLASASNVLMVPIFLAALVVARGLPALLYRRLLDGRRTGDRRPDAGDLAAVHRRRGRDRRGPRPGHRGRGRGADRRRPALGAALPADRTRPAEARRRRASARAASPNPTR